MTTNEDLRDLLAQALVVLEVDATSSRHDWLRGKIRSTLLESKTVEALVPESEIIKAFQGTQFGFKDPRGPREIISTSLKQIAEGFATGHTITVVMLELGLILNVGYRNYELTEKGKAYLKLV